MLKLAFRNLFRHRARTALTLAAVVLGVMAIVLSGGFVQDIFVQLREATIHSQLGHLQIQRPGFSEQGRQRPFDYLLRNSQAIVQSIEPWPEVSDVLRRVRFMGLASNLRADLPVIAEGVEPDKEARLGSFLTIAQGRQLQDSDTFGALMGEGAAGALQLKPGDPVILLATTSDGALNSLEFILVGTFRSFSKDYDDRAVRVRLAAAQELLTEQGVHSLVVSLAETEDTDRVAQRLWEQLGGEQLEIKTWYELADFYQKTVELYQRQFGVLQLIILVMVVLGVTNTVSMAILERTGEFGTQMALGVPGKGIFQLVLVENVFLGFFGAAVGVGSGVLIAWTVSRVGIPMPPPPNSSAGYIAHIRIVPSVVATAFAVGFVATLLAAILPARRASRLKVAEALKENI